MLSKLNRCGLVLGLSFCSYTAFGQVASFRESTFHPTNVAVEVKPLPLLLSTLPGIGSAGAGAELSTGQNAATFVNAYVIDANLANGLRSSGREEDVPVIQKMTGYSGDIGFRYYTRTAGIDSWYGGGKVGYTMAKGQWGYQDEQIDHTVRTVTPGLEAGYRWVWTNNVLFRLGVGADGNIVQENNSGAVGNETAVTEDAEDRVEGYAQVAVLPRLDLGIGYTF